MRTLDREDRGRSDGERNLLALSYADRSIAALRRALAGLLTHADPAPPQDHGEFQLLMDQALPHDPFARDR